MLVGKRDAEPVKIRAGWVVAPASLIPVLFAKPGLARHQGKSYVLEPVYFSASPAQITAMSVGELEIAALGFSSFPFAVQNAASRTCASSPMRSRTAARTTSPPITW